VQAAILNLLADLQRERGVSYVFISHDLHVVRYLSDRIAVLYLGRLLEIGPAAAVFDGPQHPYTEALLSSVPTLDGHASMARVRLSGDLPSAASPPSGCVFHTRCPRKLGAICEQQDPPFVEAADAAYVSQATGSAREAANGIGRKHLIRCHIPADELRALQTAARDQASDEASDVARDKPASPANGAGRDS
jgi:peptide/nickel transport system ATP-binding protein